MTASQLTLLIDLFTDVWARGKFYLAPREVVSLIKQIYKLDIPQQAVKRCYAIKGVRLNNTHSAWVRMA